MGMPISLFKIPFFTFPVAICNLIIAYHKVALEIQSRRASSGSTFSGAQLYGIKLCVLYCPARAYAR